MKQPTMCGAHEALHVCGLTHGAIKDASLGLHSPLSLPCYMSACAGGCACRGTGFVACGAWPVRCPLPTFEAGWL